MVKKGKEVLEKTAVLRIGGELIPLTEVDKIPGISRKARIARAGRNYGSDQLEGPFYHANHSGINWYLTKDSSMIVGRVSVKASGFGIPQISVALGSSKIELDYFSSDVDRYYPNVSLKASDMYHYGAIFLSDSMIHCKSFRLSGNGYVDKTNISVNGPLDIVDGHVNNVDIADFDIVNIQRASIGFWNHAVTLGVNPDGDQGTYEFHLTDQYIGVGGLADTYPSVPSAIHIKHRTHYGYFAGLVPVPFVRLKDNSVLIRGVIKLTQKDVYNLLNTLDDEKDSSKGEMKKLWEIYIGNYSPYNKTIPEGMKDGFVSFLESIGSRLELFATLCALNK